MTKGEDRNKDRFKNWQLCGFWKLPFRHHGAIKLTQKCVCFTNPCISPFIPTSVTCAYHPKVLERLHLLQCISANLQNTQPWVSWETQYLNLLCWILFLLDRTQQKTDQKRTEDPVEKIYACSTNSSAKSKWFILQFPQASVANQTSMQAHGQEERFTGHHQVGWGSNPGVASLNISLIGNHHPSKFYTFLVLYLIAPQRLSQAK